MDSGARGRAPESLGRLQLYPCTLQRFFTEAVASCGREALAGRGEAIGRILDE